jgi:hypothetical protein
LRTSRRRFPQNEQWKSSIGVEYYISPDAPPSGTVKCFWKAKEGTSAVIAQLLRDPS